MPLLVADEARGVPQVTLEARLEREDPDREVLRKAPVVQRIGAVADVLSGSQSPEAVEGETLRHTFTQ